MGQAGERLPWLSDEPSSAPAATGGAAVPGRSTTSTSRIMWPFYLLLLLLVAAVAAGAWWLGTRQREAPPPQLPVEDSVAIPVTRVEPAPRSPAAPATAAPEDEVRAAPPSRTAATRSEKVRTAERSAVAAEPAASSGKAGEPARPTGRSVFPAEEPAAVPPPLTGPRPVIVHHPQPNRGRVVQLGAFPTRAQADEAWRRVVRRYPYLATKPKMVNTVEVRALGGGRRTRMYRLQLGTSSQAQSAVICQQLERAGYSCVVVY